MIKFLHAADIHLDSPLKGLEVLEDVPVAEIRGATRRAFDNMIDLAIEESVNFLLIAGDLYDGDWKDYNTGLFFVQRMGRLEKAGIKVFIVSGNHDAVSQITKVMPLPSNVAMMSAKTVQSVKLDDIGVAIHGQSYPYRAVTDNLVTGFPRKDSSYFNIGLLHTSLTGRVGHEDYAPCTIDDLQSKGYEYWALGHSHQREIVADNPWIIFSGNIQGRHIKEAGAKGVTLVTVENGNITKVEHREIDVLRWDTCAVDVSQCENTPDIHNVVRRGIELIRKRANGKPLGLRICLSGQCLVHDLLFDRTVALTEEIRGIAASFGDVWLEKVQLRTKRVMTQGSLMGEDSLIDELQKTFESFAFDQSSLYRLVPELSVLKSKLPAEIYSDTQFILDASPEKMVEFRDEVETFLIAKLLNHGGLR